MHALRRFVGHLWLCLAADVRCAKVRAIGRCRHYTVAVGLCRSTQRAAGVGSALVDAAPPHFAIRGLAPSQSCLAVYGRVLCMQNARQTSLARSRAPHTSSHFAPFRKYTILAGRQCLSSFLESINK